jgi:hypothetical protein
MKIKFFVVKQPDSKFKTIMLVFWAVIFLFSSCKSNHKREEVAKIVKEWIGKEIKYIESSFKAARQLPKKQCITNKI